MSECSTYRTCEQPWQTTTVLACEKTVVMVKQPGHFTSMKKERGPGTSCLSLCLRASLGGALVDESLDPGRSYAENVRLRGWVEKINCENLFRSPISPVSFEVEMHECCVQRKASQKRGWRRFECRVSWTDCDAACGAWNREKLTILIDYRVFLNSYFRCWVDAVGGLKEIRTRWLNWGVVEVVVVAAAFAEESALWVFV